MSIAPKTPKKLIIFILLLFWVIFPFNPVLADARPRYEYHQRHSADGIGKFYLGREIAQVMGHEGAYWLERPSRGWEERPQLAIDALNLKPTDVIADIGAGTGYFSFRLARFVPQGKVLAVDIQPEMLALIEERQQQEGINNIKRVLGTVDNPNLPENSLDLVLMVDAYHEFEYPYEMMQGIYQALKPSGRVVLLEYIRENPLVLIKTLHKMSQKQVKKEMAAIGLTWKETLNVLPQQHLMIFQKSLEKSVVN